MERVRFRSFLLNFYWHSSNKQNAIWGRFRSTSSFGLSYFVFYLRSFNWTYVLNTFFITSLLISFHQVINFFSYKVRCKAFWLSLCEGTGARIVERSHFQYGKKFLGFLNTKFIIHNMASHLFHGSVFLIGLWRVEDDFFLNLRMRTFG